MGTKGRRRCKCRRVLLEAGSPPCIEATSSVGRIRHTLGACEPYRTMERRANPAEDSSLPKK